MRPQIAKRRVRSRHDGYARHGTVLAQNMDMIEGDQKITVGQMAEMADVTAELWRRGDTLLQGRDLELVSARPRADPARRSRAAGTQQASRGTRGACFERRSHERDVMSNVRFARQPSQELVIHWSGEYRVAAHRAIDHSLLNQSGATGRHGFCLYSELCGDVARLVR
jgi:hypothetical protein